MSVERPYLRIRPESHRIVVRNLTNRETLETLQKMDTEPLQALTRTMVKGLSRNDDIITPERRQRILTVLPFVPFDKLDAQDLRANYVKAIKWQKKESDPSGTVKDLLTGGFVLAMHLPTSREAYLEITNAWKNVIPNVKSHTEWQTVGVKYLDLEEALRPDPPRNRPTYSLKTLIAEYNRGFATTTIGTHMGLSRDTVNEGISQLRSLGLISEKRPSTRFKTYKPLIR